MSTIVVLPDLENIWMAVGISFLSYTEARDMRHFISTSD